MTHRWDWTVADPKPPRVHLRRGAYTVIEGRIYPFNRAIHVVPSFVPPAEWPRYRAIDFGVRDPFVCLWIAWDTATDTMHVYRELYVTDRSTLHNGATIAEWSAEERRPALDERGRRLLDDDGGPATEPLPHEWTVADSADLNARMILANEYDIATHPAIKDIDEGINAVCDRLRPDAEGMPHLVVHACCPNTIREHEGWAWRPNQSRMPMDRDNHTCDCARYHVLFHALQYPRRSVMEAEEAAG